MLQNGTYAGGQGYPRVADQIDSAVLKKVHEWFDEHAVAWSGTPVELGTMIGRPNQQVVHAIEIASVTLLVFGIAASLSRRPGLPTVIVLRHLEEISPDIDSQAGASDSEWPRGTSAMTPRDELPLASFCPADEAAHSEGGRRLGGLLLAVFLFLRTRMTNHTMRAIGQHIGSWLTSIASKESRGERRHEL